MTEYMHIPIFPLPNVILFPDTLLPLHIFEPRYRAMVTTTLAGARRVGMVLLKPGWEPDYYETPETFAIGSVGHIGQYEQLEDGGYNIVLSGESKFRINRFTQEKPFRVAQVEILHDAVPGGRALKRRKAELVQLYKTLLKNLGDENVSVLDTLLALSMARVVNMVAAGLSIPVYDKQALLELDSIDARYQSVVAILKSQLAVCSIYRDFRALVPEDPRVN